VASAAFDKNGENLIIGSHDEEISVWPFDDISVAEKPSTVIKGMGAGVDWVSVQNSIVVTASLDVIITFETVLLVLEKNCRNKSVLVNISYFAEHRVKY